MWRRVSGSVARRVGLRERGRQWTVVAVSAIVRRCVVVSGLSRLRRS